MRPRRLRLALVLAVALAAPAAADEGQVVVATTHATWDSGFFSYLLPIFTNASGVPVGIAASSAADALKRADDGDADVLLLDGKQALTLFVEKGDGVERLELMYSDLLLVGPAADPAGVKGGKDLTKALQQIAAHQAPYLAPTEGSGAAELATELWDQAGIAVQTPPGSWYSPASSAAGPTLAAAGSLGAYSFADRATWAAGSNPGLAILVEGAPPPHNSYGLVLVDDADNKESAQIFIEWLLSPAGQSAIAGFKAGGKQLFHPDAAPGN